MRTFGLVIAGLVLTLGGLAWWLWPGAVAIVPDPPGATGGPPGDLPFVSRADLEAVDAGVGRVTGVVQDETGSPVAGVRVRLFVTEPVIDTLRCAVCHAAVLDCSEHTTTQRLIHAIRDGSLGPPAVFAETRTDGEGRYVFEEAPLGGVVFASTGTGSAYQGVSGDDEMLLELSEPTHSEIALRGDDERPLVGATLWLYEPLDGALTSFTSDTEGVVKASSLDPLAWVFAEAEGALPVGRRLQWATRFALVPPRTLVVKTLHAGQPIEADVSLTLHGELRTLRTREGLLRLEGLPMDYYSVTVVAGDLSASEQSRELYEPVTELVFDLRPSARLVVGLTDAEGNPIERVSGSLSGDNTSLSSDAEHGALLMIGPVPEGEYELYVSSDGMAPVRRTVDLRPGETRLDLTLRGAPKLAGLVLGADGKPASGARVGAFESDVEVAVDIAADDGTFTLELPYAGRFVIKAETAVAGVAEAAATVPGAGLTLKLSERGVIEVQLLDDNGAVIAPDFMVRSKSGAEVRWIDDGSGEGHWGRLAGLATGTYTLMKDLPDRVPITKDVEVVEGRTTRVTIKAERGASITGRLVDHLGKPITEASIVTPSRSDHGRPDAQGRFELGGLPSGRVEVWAIVMSGAETPHLTVEAPARDVVLTLAQVLRVRGRVVDEAGGPIKSFTVNAVPVRSADGRFEVEAPHGSVDVWAEGFTEFYVSDAKADVGDVVLKKEPQVEGEVTDGEGRPVGGVSVQLSLDAMPTTTDVLGHFRLPIASEEPQEIVATRGSLSGRAPVQPGRYARLVLQKGTHVSGRVVDAEGRGVPSVVTATSRDTPRSLTIDTDEQGRFETEVAQGVWMFTSRSNRVVRAVEMRGERVELVLGELPGACALTVAANGDIDGVWLLSKPPPDSEGAWEFAGRTPGSVEVTVGAPAAEIVARGLPCGSFTLVASFNGQFATQVVTLRGSERVQLALPAQDDEP